MRARALLRRAGWGAAIALLVLACDVGTFGPTPGTGEPATNPATGATPVPLATLQPGDAGLRDAAIPADAARQPPDAAPIPPRPLEAHAPPVEDAFVSRDGAGVALRARWRWHGVPADDAVPDGAAEKDVLAIRERTALWWDVHIAAPGRMRVVADSRSLPLPQGGVYLARLDRYGTVVVWPDGLRYRVVPVGALRTTLGEGRVDVTPLATGEVIEGAAGEHLGVPTRTVTVISRVGRVELDMGRVPEAGEGAALLCRMLVEIVGVEPSSPVCAAEQLVMGARFSWAGAEVASPADSGVVLEVTELRRQLEAVPHQLLLPPAEARWIRTGLPRRRTQVFLNEPELASLREADDAPPAPPPPGAPNAGLSAVNQSDMRLYLLLDGIPIAAVAPWDDLVVTGLRSGRYKLQWRSFLGELVQPAIDIDIPARVVHGDADAGASPPPDVGP